MGEKMLYLFYKSIGKKKTRIELTNRKSLWRMLNFLELLFHSERKIQSQFIADAILVLMRLVR
jgi:hypothetical protein